MNGIQKALIYLATKAGRFDGTNEEPNKLYAGFSSIFGRRSFSFSDRTFKEFINNGYKESPEVFSVVNKILSKAAAVPIVIKERTRDGEEVIKGTEFETLITCPNPLQTKYDWIFEGMLYYLLTGNNYMNGVKSVGFGDAFFEVTNLPSQSTAPVRSGSASTPIAGYEMQTDTQALQTFEADEVMHIKNVDPSLKGVRTLVGMSPLETGKRPYTTGNNNWEANANILENLGALGIISSNTNNGNTVMGTGGSNKKMDVEEEQTRWKKWYGGPKNYGTPLFTPASITYTQIGMSPTDLKLIENNIMVLRSICNIYNVDSSLFNDPDNKKFDNVEAAERSMWSDAIMPLLRLYEEKLNLWLAPGFRELENKDLVLRFDFSDIAALQEDKEVQAKRAIELSDSGIISRNEARIVIGEEPSTADGMDVPTVRTTRQNPTTE